MCVTIMSHGSFFFHICGAVSASPWGLLHGPRPWVWAILICVVAHCLLSPLSVCLMRRGVCGRNYTHVGLSFEVLVGLASPAMGFGSRWGLLHAHKSLGFTPRAYCIQLEMSMVSGCLTARFRAPRWTHYCACPGLGCLHLLPLGVPSARCLCLRICLRTFGVLTPDLLE